MHNVLDDVSGTRVAAPLTSMLRRTAVEMVAETNGQACKPEEEMRC